MGRFVSNTGYSGEYYDNETGYIYLRARYYDPRTSRMLSEDPIKFTSGTMPNGQKLVDPLSLNLYIYCASNPILFVDPSGLYYDYDQNGVRVNVGTPSSYYDYDANGKRVKVEYDSTPAIIKQRLNLVNPTPERIQQLSKPAETKSPTNSGNNSNNYAASNYTGNGLSHTGLDFSGGQGDPIYATNRGYVIESINIFYNDFRYHYNASNGWYYSENSYGAWDSDGENVSQKYYGNRVVIQHDGYLSRSAHMMYTDSPLVLAGNYVLEGDIIGYIGGTGNTLGDPSDHLHFEITENGNRQNPIGYVP